MSIINKRINAIAIREYKGNNSAFAKVMGTSEANIRNYRKETMPKLDFIVKLHEVFEISFDSLLSEKKISHKDKPAAEEVSTNKEELYYKMLSSENDLLKEKLKFQQEQIDFYKNKIEFLNTQLSTGKALNAKEIEDGLNIIDEIENISLKKSTKLVK
jgi:transcriptional regulator with XRE-family HTH domain